MLLFLCLWNKRRGSSSLSQGKKIWDCSLHKKNILGGLLRGFALWLKEETLLDFSARVWAERLPPERPVDPPSPPPVSRTCLTSQPTEDRLPGTHPCRSARDWNHCLGLQDPAQTETCQGHCCPTSGVGPSDPVPEGDTALCSTAPGAKVPLWISSRDVLITPIHSCTNSVSAIAPPRQHSLSCPFASQNGSVSLCPSTCIPGKELLGTQDGGTAAPSP